MRISVCMATYNGEPYIEDQLRSILIQLNDEDEVVICDDGSTDSTLEKIHEINDHRIRTYSNEFNLGYVKNFEKAVSLAEGEYIFLSDQDDIWPENRVFKMISRLVDSDKMVVVGNMECFYHDPTRRRPFHYRAEKKYDTTASLNLVGLFSVGRIPYYGCCMAFKREFLPDIIPFPSKRVGHDIWIAIISNYNSSVSHLEEVVTYRRLHGSNLSQQAGFLDRLTVRYYRILSLLKYIRARV